MFFKKDEKAKNKERKSCVKKKIQDKMVVIRQVEKIGELLDNIRLDIRQLS